MIPSRMVRPLRTAAWCLAALALLLPGCHHHRKREVLENEALYDRAQQLIERRKFLKAIEMLGDVGLNSPVSEALDPDVKLALADAYFFQSGTVNSIEAQSRYEQFLSFYPLHPKARYARYMIGLCLTEQAEDPEKDQEYSQKALGHFEQMVGDLPADDPWARAAKIQLLRAQDRLAEHEWLIAQFYRGRQRWPGAIGRLSTLTDRYPGSRRRGEAFLQLAEAYRDVGNAAQARLAIDRLQAEYPGSDLAGRAEALKKTLNAGGEGLAQQSAAPAAPEPRARR